MKQILRLGLKSFFITKIAYYTLIYFLYLFIDVENNLDAKSLVNASLGKDVLFIVSYLLGVCVLYFDGKKLVKTKIISLINTKEYIEMYNVEFVKKNHTFFANGILVHNKLEE